jgi:hypothetical protein
MAEVTVTTESGATEKQLNQINFRKLLLAR